MPLAEITVSEAYPVFDIFTKDDHWSEKSHHQYIQWQDVPQELIDEHKNATEIWQNSQRKIAEFWQKKY